MKERLLNIFRHFSYTEQLKKLAEECHEFIAEPTDKSEIADVFIVSSQLYHADKEVREQVKYKLARTEKRIKEGYYENN